MAEFLNWAQGSAQAGARSDFLDDEVAAYVEYLWQEGEGASKAHYTLAAIQFFVPPARRNLNLAWGLVGSWDRLELPARAPPLLVEALRAICGLCVSIGREDAALVMLVGFHCMLRSGEMAALTFGAFVLDVPAGRGAVNLGLTKSGKRVGKPETCTLSDAGLVRALARAGTGRLPGDRVLRGSPQQLRSLFTDSCKALQLSECGFKLYSIRRGAATEDFRRHGSLSRTVVRGRWENAKTARLYINEGVAMLCDIQLSAAQRQFMAEAAVSLRHFAR